MANPFLVLGGIAVGLVVATFGVVQVPGWIASAQDAAAQSDLSHVRSAQAAAASSDGDYIDDFNQLSNGSAHGVSFTLSGGVQLVGMAANADGWCATLKSASGTFFAATNDGTATAAGSTAEDALAAAGCANDLTEQTLPSPPTAVFTLNCPTSLSVGLPLQTATGTATWSDGTTQAATGATTPKKALTAGQDYQVTFRGTFTSITSLSLTGAEKECFRSMDKWVGPTQTNSAANAFDGMANLTTVPAKIPSGITKMNSMFNGATSFNSPIGGWDTSQVETMEQMFANARAFNRDISSWDTRNVKTMRMMFYGAHVFDQPIGSWQTTELTSTQMMFRDAKVFNQPIGGWTMSKVTTAAEMFRGASKFNQPLAAWHLPLLKDLTSMFSSATEFSQDLSGWSLPEYKNTSAPVNFSASSKLTAAQLPKWGGA